MLFWWISLSLNKGLFILSSHNNDNALSGRGNTRCIKRTKTNPLIFGKHIFNKQFIIFTHISNCVYNKIAGKVIKMKHYNIYSCETTCYIHVLSF